MSARQEQQTNEFDLNEHLNCILGPAVKAIEKLIDPRNLEESQRRLARIKDICPEAGILLDEYARLGKFDISMMMKKKTLSNTVIELPDGIIIELEEGAFTTSGMSKQDYVIGYRPNPNGNCLHPHYDGHFDLFTRGALPQGIARLDMNTSSIWALNQVIK